MANVRVVQQSPSVGRKLRNPKIPFVTKQQPYEIRPFMIHPVLPGETMKSLNYQASVYSGELVNNLGGWWYEVYFFYVKHRDLVEREMLTSIHVENVTDGALVTAASPIHYHASGINWVKMCLQRVTEEYFRHEDEAWNVATATSGLPLASISRDDWLDSAQRDGAIAEGDVDQLPDEVVEEGLHADHGIPAGFEAAYDTWLSMRRNRLIEVDFEDYLKANGIKVPKEKVDPHRPELIRYLQDWELSKPGLDVVGNPVGTVSWKLQERADKDRFISEPGFLFGVSVARPKIYINQAGTASGMMNDAFTWLPALLRDNPETSLKQITDTQAAALLPDYAGSEGVWFDVRDLLLYGEQYLGGVDFAGLSGIVPGLAVPDADLNRRYPVVEELDALWTPEPDPGFPPKRFGNAFVTEGVVSLSIASRISDTSGYGQQLNPEV